MTYDSLEGIAYILAAIGISGWIAAIWQHFMASEAEEEKRIAQIEHAALTRQNNDLIRDLAFPPYGYQPRDLQGRFVKPKDMPRRFDQASEDWMR